MVVGILIFLLIMSSVYDTVRKSLKEKVLNRTRYHKKSPNLLHLLLRSRPFSKALRFYYNNESRHPINFYHRLLWVFPSAGTCRYAKVMFAIDVIDELPEFKLARLWFCVYGLLEIIWKYIKEIFFSVKETPTECYIALYITNCYHVFHCAPVIVHTVQKQLV